MTEVALITAYAFMPGFNRSSFMASMEIVVSAPVIKCKKTPVKKCRFVPERMMI